MGLLDLYNKPADVANNYINRTYTAPRKPTLQDAYNQAMGKSTPSWAYALADAMPSIGQIIAAQTIKDEFQQQPVADSLERQKDRQIAYSQAMQDRENQNAKDFVAMAKDQLGMDAAEEERDYNRQIADLNRNESLEARKQAYQQWEAEQKAKAEQFEFNKVQANKENLLKEKALAIQQRKSEAEVNEIDKKIEILDKQLANMNNGLKADGSPITTDNDDTTKFSDSQKAIVEVLKKQVEDGKITMEQYLNAVNKIQNGEFVGFDPKKKGLLNGVNIADIVAQYSSDIGNNVGQKLGLIPVFKEQGITVQKIK